MKGILLKHECVLISTLSDRKGQEKELLALNDLTVDGM